MSCESDCEVRGRLGLFLVIGPAEMRRLVDASLVVAWSELVCAATFTFIDENAASITLQMIFPFEV